MSEEKTNTFEQKALSHIPPEFIRSMLDETKVETDGMGAMEAIRKATGNSPLPVKQEGSVSVPTAGNTYFTIAVDGEVIKVSSDRMESAVTMFMYLIAAEFSKNKRIAKILKQFNFTFMDANGKQLYPKKGKKRG